MRQTKPNRASIIRPQLVYLCLQATREGQASFAHVHEIVNGLRDLGWRVQLFEPGFAQELPMPGALGRIAAFLRVQAALAIRVLRQRSGVIYIRSHFAAFPTALLARVLRIPSVQEVNGPFEDMFIAWPWTQRFSRIFIWLARAQLRWADAIVVVTPQYRQWVTDQVGAKRVVVISNGANTDLFRPDVDVSTPLPQRYAIFFGALAEWQGIGTILESIVHPAWPADVSLVVIGEGTEQARLLEMAMQEPKIRYLGKLPYAEMPGVIGNALVSLSPQTDLRGRAKLGLFPLKVFESLACGVPVVVTDHPGQADIVREHACGWVIPPGDVGALVAAVSACAIDPAAAQAMGRRGRSAVARYHSWRARAAQTADLLQSIAKS